MSGFPRVTAMVLLCGVTTSVGLLSLDSAEERRDFFLVAELSADVTEHQGEPDARFTEQRAEGDELLGRTCIQRRCLAHIRTDSGTTRSIGPAFDQGDPIRLLRSPSRDALVLEADGDPLAIMDDDPAAWEWRTPTTFDTGAWLRAMPSLVATSASGWLLALLLLAIRSRFSQRLRRLKRAKEGRVESGWLRLSDASRPRRVNAVRVAQEDGPVLVCFSPRSAAPYRGDDRDRPFELLEGDRQDNEQPVIRRTRQLDMALALASCTAAPLIAALIVVWLG